MDTIQRLIGSHPILRAQSTSSLLCIILDSPWKDLVSYSPALCLLTRPAKGHFSAEDPCVELIHSRIQGHLCVTFHDTKTLHVQPLPTAGAPTLPCSTSQPSGVQDGRTFPRAGRCRVPKTEPCAPTAVKRQELSILECLEPLESTAKYCRLAGGIVPTPLSRFSHKKISLQG